MYYNIKIKSNGCEFSLDSFNKNIIQNEMDKYFASMFNASDEFKSRIKKVTIVDDNIKSIEDFEKINIKSQSDNNFVLPKDDDKQINAQDDKQNLDENFKEDNIEEKSSESIVDRSSELCDNHPSGSVEENLLTDEIKHDEICENSTNEQTDELIQKSETKDEYLEKNEIYESESSNNKLKDLPINQTLQEEIEDNNPPMDFIETPVSSDVENLPSLTYEDIKQAKNYQTEEEFEKINLDELIEYTEQNEEEKFDIQEDLAANYAADTSFNVVSVSPRKEVENNSSPSFLHPQISIVNQPIDEKKEDEDGIDELISIVEKEIKAIDISDSTVFNDALFENYKNNNQNKLKVVEELVLDENDILQVSLPSKAVEFTKIENKSILDNKDKINQKVDNSQNSKNNFEDLPFDNENDTDDFIESKSVEEEKLEDVNQHKLDDLFSINSIDDDKIENKEDINQNPQTDNEENEEKPKYNKNELIDEININPIPSYKEYLEIINKNENNSSIEVKDIEPRNENLISVQEENVDFKTYLSKFNTSDLVDEFLICSYYIKNILKQDCFSMKFINSKLFPATGEIADMLVLGKLISLGYIKTVEIEDMRKYTITNDGENYFTSKFQN